MRHHESIQKCCAAVDVVNGHGKDDPITLQQSQALMTQWKDCQANLTDRYPEAQALGDSLQKFREYFLSVMQQGFHDKETSLRDNLVKLIHSCVDSVDNKTFGPDWDTLRTELDDYMRLSTADVFTQDDKERMSSIASAVDVFWKLSSAGFSDANVKLFFYSFFQMLVND